MGMLSVSTIEPAIAKLYQLNNDQTLLPMVFQAWQHVVDRR